MLENGHSNLQTNLWVHITSNIFKISNSKITGSHQPPDLPTLKAYPTPGVGGRFGIFSLKWRERMNLKVPGAILPLGFFFSTRAKIVRGLVQPPLGELGLMGKKFKNNNIKKKKEKNPQSILIKIIIIIKIWPYFFNTPQKYCRLDLFFWEPSFKHDKIFLRVLIICVTNAKRIRGN